MSSVRLVLKDFRAIRRADLRFESGVTLVCAPNSSGKSTSMLAMLALLDGDFADASHFRHGTSAWTVACEVDGRSVAVVRDGKRTRVSVDARSFTEGLGRGGVGQLCPDFPLRRLEYDGQRFYPNFVRQGSLPLFEDVSVYDLFSSMFSDVDRVSRRLDDLRSEQSKVSKGVSAAEANLEYLKSRRLDMGSVLEELEAEYPSLDSDLSSALASQSLLDSVAALEAELGGLASDVDVPLVEEALGASELFPLLDFMDAVVRIESMYGELASIDECLASFPGSDAVFVSYVLDLDVLMDGLACLDVRLGCCPDFVLLELGLTVISSQERLFVVDCSLGELAGIVDDAVASLGGVCPLVDAAGVCPFVRP